MQEGWIKRLVGFLRETVGGTSSDLLHSVVIDVGEFRAMGLDRVEPCDSAEPLPGHNNMFIISFRYKS